MLKIRDSVFETNSSSTHSLILCSEEEYTKFQKGEMVVDTEREVLVPAPNYSDDQLRRRFLEDKVIHLKNGVVYDSKFYPTLEHAIDDEEIKISRAELDQYKEDWEYETYYSYYNRDCDVEFDKKVYETKSGEKVVAFGYGGYDG